MVINPIILWTLSSCMEAESRFLYRIRITAMIFTGQQMRL